MAKREDEVVSTQAYILNRSVLDGRLRAKQSHFCTHFSTHPFHHSFMPWGNEANSIKSSGGCNRTAPRGGEKKKQILVLKQGLTDLKNQICNLWESMSCSTAKLIEMAPKRGAVISKPQTENNQCISYTWKKTMSLQYARKIFVYNKPVLGSQCCNLLGQQS